jgi:hypothetical protein
MTGSNMRTIKVLGLAVIFVGILVGPAVALALTGSSATGFAVGIALVALIIGTTIVVGARRWVTTHSHATDRRWYWRVRGHARVLSVRGGSTTHRDEREVDRTCGHRAHLLHDTGRRPAGPVNRHHAELDEGHRRSDRYPVRYGMRARYAAERQASKAAPSCPHEPTGPEVSGFPPRSANALVPALTDC